MANVSANVASYMLSSGQSVPISLLELQLVDGSRYFMSDAPIQAVPLLAQFDEITVDNRYTPAYGGPDPVHPGTYSTDSTTPQPFQPWLTKLPEFSFTSTLATATADASFQNVSGDTVNRAGSLLFSAADLWGAMFFYRLWLAAAEFALITVLGKVDDAAVDGDNIDLSLSDFGNWSQIKAPDCTIDVSCGNVFGSPQCGSIASTPCQNSYGSCTQLNRFKGVVIQWNSGVTSIANATGIAQPVPPFNINLMRPV